VRPALRAGARPTPARIRERDGFDRRVWLNVPVRRLDWQREGYGGPCPPSGRHRYVHKLYALDTVLPVLKPATKAALERAMQGHILAKGELVGYYEKRN
jgi:Raf kinase inhibitor-like YbhB/YbcL family protein